MTSKKIILLTMGVILILMPLLMMIMDNYTEMPPVVYNLEHGEYVVGEDINPGVYYVISQNDSMEVNGIKMDADDQILGIPLSVGDSLTVEGSGTIKIVPSDYMPHNLDDNGEIVLEYSGNYGVGGSTGLGDNIDAGTYEMTYRVEEGEVLTENPTIYVYSDESMEEEVASYSLEEQGSYEITLEEGQVFSVWKSPSDESLDLEFVLKPVE